MTLESLSRTLSEKEIVLNGVSKIIKTVKDPTHATNPTITGMRRVHEDGIIVLDNHYTMK